MVQPRSNVIYLDGATKHMTSISMMSFTWLSSGVDSNCLSGIVFRVLTDLVKDLQLIPSSYTCGPMVTTIKITCDGVSIQSTHKLSPHSGPWERLQHENATSGRLSWSSYRYMYLVRKVPGSRTLIKGGQQEADMGHRRGSGEEGQSPVKDVGQ